MGRGSLRTKNADLITREELWVVTDSNETDRNQTGKKPNHCF